MGEKPSSYKKMILLPLPPYFPEKHDWEEQQKIISRKYCGINAQTQSELAKRHDDLYWHTKAPLYPQDEHTLRTFSFLGFPDEETFLARLPDMIFERLRGADRERFDKVIRLASFAHEGQKRAGGMMESYICHPLRAAWYYVSSIENGFMRYKKYPDNEVVETIILHDLKEEFPEQTAISPLSIKFRRGKDIMDLSIKPEQAAALNTLASASKTAYLQAASRNRLAATVKLFDRLDNTLTLFHINSFPRMLRNLDETSKASAKIAFESQRDMSHIKYLFSDFSPEDLKSYLFLYLIAQGQHLATLQQIRQSLLSSPEQTVPEPPLNTEIQKLIDERGIRASHIPSTLGIKALAAWYRFRKKIENDPGIFSFQDIKNHLAVLTTVFFKKSLKLYEYPENPFKEYYLWE